MSLEPDTLTFDCADPVRVAAFWAQVLGFEPDDDDPEADAAYLADPSGRTRGIYFQTVPEPKVVKNRVHLDVRPAGTMDEEVERLRALGAEPIRLVRERSTWTVMRDVEGNEFCVLAGGAEGAARTRPGLDSLVVDCTDPFRVASFWLQALDYREHERGETGIEIVGRRDGDIMLSFVTVPEPKTVKDRIHLDVRPTGSMEEEVRRMTGLGASTGGFIEDPRERRGRSGDVLDRDGRRRGQRVLRAPGAGRRLDAGDPVTESKVTTMHDAVAELVRDGDTVAIEGFTHLICFAAGHEIVRQRKRDLTLARMTPDVIYDQMVAGGVASKLIFSWLGNPGVGSLHAIRRRIEDHDPGPLEIEEYSHFGMVCRYVAGASNLPFFPIRSYYESDIPKVNPKIVPMRSPYEDGTEVYVVPPLVPDVAIVHVQRADAAGDAQIWGLLGCQKEAAFAAKRVIVVCEEVVDESVIRRDPNRTAIPGVVVDAVVHEPFACHPSFAQGYYDRDNAFYLEWDRIARDPETLEAWMQEWIYDLGSHRDYVEKRGDASWASLRPGTALSGEVDYGSYA